MVNSMFIQIHTLHSYPAALLNRDDSGLAKRLTFGDAVRTRISSQCLKRHWRKADGKFSIHNIDGAKVALRSRNVVGRKIMKSLRDDSEFAPDVIDAVEAEFTKGIYGNSAKPGENADDQSTRQPLLLGFPEVQYFRTKAKEICEEHSDDAKKAENAVKEFFDNYEDNFKAMREQLKVDIPIGHHGGLEGALFGRMVTSDPGANIDAAVHVAHAFTVHQQETEDEYFIAVDDLQLKDEEGASFIGDTELTAGLFYGYVVVDVPGLVSNLEGCESEKWQTADRTLTARVVEHLIHLIATVSPGAKRGSTAPYAYADLMLLETGSRQPRSLANAFRNPSKPQVDDAASRLVAHLDKLDNCYGLGETRRLMSVEDCNMPGSERLNLNDLASWAAAVVRNGKAS